MAITDSTVSELGQEAPAKGSLKFYAVDPDEPIAADRSKYILFETLMDSLLTNDGELVVNEGNVVIGG